VYETKPVGGPEQDDFYNAAVAFATHLTPEDVFARCLLIEHSMGRVRRELWGPRIIDLDLLMFGDLVISTDDLVVPHPAMAERGFVLTPLADIAPEVIHPVRGVSIRDLSGRIGAVGVVRRNDLVLKMEM